MPSVISERALFERCRRKLWTERRLFLRRCPERSQWFRELGRYYMIDEGNHIAGWSASSIDELARAIGVLRPDERLLG